MREVLRHRDLRLLLAGQAVSQAGDWLYGVALLVYVLDVTGSAAWVAAAGVAQLVPWIALSPIGGLLADRLSRRRILVATDVAQLVAMLALAVVAAADGPPGLTLAIAALAATAGVAASPALQSALPLMVEERSLAAVNSLLTAIVSLSMVLGPAIGAVLLLLGSAAVAFGVNALTFAISAACFLLLRTPMGPLPGEDRGAIDTGWTTAARIAAAARAAAVDLRAGVGALASSATAAVIVAVAAVILFAYEAQVVLWAVLADERLGSGADALTLLFVAYGAGGLLATIPASRAAAGPSGSVVLAGAVVVGGLAVASLAAVESLMPSVALVGLQGVVVTMADVLVITLLQRVLGARVLGRAIGAMDSVTGVAMVVGSVMAPVALAVAGLGGSFVVFGIALACAGALAFVVIGRPAAVSAGVAERVPILAALSLFEGAPRFALEGLAADCREVRADAGTVLIREGDQPDDLYVLVSGAARVTAGGGDAMLAMLGPGDFFGEIGLLKHIPRTATVTASQPSTLLRIDGELFLTMVQTGVAHSGTLGRSVGLRLARGRVSGMEIGDGGGSPS